MHLFTLIPEKWCVQLLLTLAHFLWQGAAIAVLAAVAALAMRHRSASSRYRLYLAALALMAAAPVATFMVLISTAAHPRMAIAVHSQLVAPATPRPAHQGTPPAGIAVAPTIPAIVVTPPRPPLANTAESPTPAHRHGWAQYAVAAYFIGVALMLIRLLVSLHAGRMLRRRATPIDDPQMLNMLHAQASRLGLRITPAIACCADVLVPTLAGLLKPMILVPLSVLAELPPQQLEAIITHELAHVKRWDHIVNVIQRFIEAILFFHPAVWFISLRIRIERELCCDDLVVSLSGQATDYAQSLVRVAELSRWMSPTGTSLAATGTNTPRALRRRILRLMGRDPHPQFGTARAWVSAVLIGLCVAFVMTWTRHSIAKASPTTQPAHTLDLLVLDKASGKPLAKARLDLNVDGKEKKLVTDADGHLLAPWPQNSHEHYRGVVHAKGYADRLLEWRSPAKDPVPSTYTIKLERGTKIGGKVVDDTGQPVPGAHVVIWILTSNSPARKGVHDRNYVHDKTVRSNNDGTWNFDGAPLHFKAEVGVWDYRYANGDAYPMNSFSPETLHSNAVTLKLHHGLPIEGIVVDKDGKPIKGASVLTGAQLCSNRVPAQKTKADGKFTYFVTPGQQFTVTVTCKGFAPELKQIVMGNEKQQMRVQLSPAQPMIGRVVGPDGKPVPGAWIIPDTWRGNRSLDLRIHADKNGKFIWKDAPRDTVYCDVDGTASGYVLEQKVPLTASDHEIVVKLRKALHVSGTVVDAQTGKPIDSFKVIQEISWNKGNPVTPEWQNAQTQWHGGKFDLVEDWSYPGYALRIEADGYVPATSRIFTLDEKHVSLKFKLTKGKQIAATVLTPNGKPAADATAALATSDATAYIINGRKMLPGQQCPQTTTSSKGKLVFPPPAGPFKIVVFSADGYAVADPDALAKSSIITLKAWARIEGKLKIGNHPGAGEQIDVRLNPNQPPDLKQPRVYNQIQTQTDRDGKFVIDRIPAGKIEIAREVMRPTGGGSSIGSYTQTQKLSLAPGQTAKVTLGGMGRAVVGRIDIPASLKAEQAWYYGIGTDVRTKVQWPKPPLPADLKNATLEKKRQWYSDFQKSAAGKEYQAAVKKAQEANRSYPMEIDPNGAFRVEDVAAGRYQASVSICRKSGANRCGASGDQIATGSVEFTVPEMPSGRDDQPLKIPTISMHVLKNVKVGDVAPDFAVKTLDGKELKLSSFRGKYVLLDFWATWCGPCVQEVPHLKDAYASFGSNPNLVMISLSLDDKMDAPRTFAAKHGMAWTQGFLGNWNKDSVTKDYGVRGIPSIWLIDPQGKVVARDLRGDAISAQIRAALAKK